MTEQHNDDNRDLRPAAPEKFAGDELDTAGKSLSEALRMSFVILKVIMIVLVVCFLASGFEKVDPGEQALVLRFGKIRGVGEKRLLGPGAHWILPYPIDEIVKIPVEAKVPLAINSFWYWQSKEDMLSETPRPVRPNEPLKPLRDGYCITRSEQRADAAADPAIDQEITVRGTVEVSTQGGEVEAELTDISVSRTHSDGSDYNIVHTKWQLTYQIDDPELFFRNIYVEDIKIGDIDFDVTTESIRPLLEDIFEDAVVTTMVYYTIDQALSSLDRIERDVQRRMQDKLGKIGSGIKVVSAQLTRSEPPPQLKKEFEASFDATQASHTEITNATTYAKDTLSEAAGTARQEIAEAEAYRTRVVETAKANADYLQRLLPEYRQRPKLVVHRIYLDAIEQIFENAAETFVIQPGKNAGDTELRVLLNRDPSLKPKASKEQATREGQ
jgi:regulator of protease activity HflC (stomatin/prohibitin superfamily)